MSPEGSNLLLLLEEGVHVVTLILYFWGQAIANPVPLCTVAQNTGVQESQEWQA